MRKTIQRACSGFGINGGIHASGDGRGRAALEGQMPARPAGRAPRRGHASRDDSPRGRLPRQVEGTGSSSSVPDRFFLVPVSAR